jgi:CelD/BcsL family acetyltransferase involved in cellulose biosynthesis
MTLVELSDPAWGEFVASRPEATLFHHPAWAGLLAECYGFRALAVAVPHRGAPIAAGAPVIEVARPLGRRRWVSLPFTDHCSPLGAGAEVGADLVAALTEAGRSRALDGIEVRAPLRAGDGVQWTSAHVRHELPLAAGVDRVWAGLNKNHRRNVRIAERAGVRIVRGSAAEDLEVFYRLHLRTRRRLGVPIQPRRFFRLLRERILAPGLGFIVNAYSGEVPVASAVFGSHNGTLIYKYSARDERYAKLDANYLLLWSAIRWGCESGHRAFDLGRSDLDQPLLRGFKDGWGAREDPLSYAWIARAPMKTRTRRLDGALGMVIRNSSPLLCRAVGELFYKYAG